MRLKAFAAALSCALSFFASAASAETLTFGQNPDVIRIPHDISITRVSIRVDGFKVGGSADYCLAMYRQVEPVYPIEQPIGRGGFIEPVCFNTVRSKAVDGWVYPITPTNEPVLVPAGDWEQHVDLTRTPVFVPEGTTFVCGSLGTVSSILPSGSIDGTCVVEYHRYKPGTPRYRFLRLPFYDQMFSADKPLVTSYFQSYTGGRSLEIASAVAYIGNNHHDSHMEACLKRSRHGLETERFCFPPADQDSPGQITLNWRIHQGERLALDCHYPPSDKVSSGDCAIYLVAKLPDDLKLSPENSFRDYGELPRDYVTDWCEATAKVVTEEIVHNPMLCLGKEGDTCSHAQKMTNCVASLDLWSFPKASCMADNSCYLPTHRLEGLLGLLGILGAVGIAALARRMA